MKKLNFKKLFCFISMLFILSCCIFYGTRFIKLYLENKKTEVEEKNTLTKKVKDNNSNNDNFKSLQSKLTKNKIITFSWFTTEELQQIRNNLNTNNKEFIFTKIEDEKVSNVNYNKKNSKGKKNQNKPKDNKNKSQKQNIKKEKK